MGLVNLAEGCDLHSLEIYGNAITDIGVIRLAERCPNLQSFNIRSCESITDMCIVRLAEACNLHSLTLGHCHNSIFDTGINRIAELCPHLLHLHLSACFEVTDKCIIAVAEGCPAL
jgi:hypothetical protein